MEKEYRWLDTKYVKVPSVLGENKDGATKTLKGLKVEYSGVGDNVIYQSSSAGTFIKEGGTVKLMLG